MFSPKFNQTYAKQGGFTVYNGESHSGPNGGILIDIRKGNVVLADIVKQAEIDIKKLDELYRNSDLPDSVDDNFVNQLLLEMRHAYEDNQVGVLLESYNNFMENNLK